MAIYALRAAPLFHSPSAVSLDALDFPPRSYTFNNTSVHDGERPCGLHCEYETVERIECAITSGHSLDPVGEALPSTAPSFPLSFSGDSPSSIGGGAMLFIGASLHCRSRNAFDFGSGRHCS